MSNVKMYQDIGAYSEVLGSSSCQQIHLLMTRVKTDLKGAIGALEYNDIATKCKCISSANAIVSYLRDCLNFDAEGDIAPRLEGIYSHLEKQLFLANAENRVDVLQQCLVIMENVHVWWRQIAELS